MLYKVLIERSGDHCHLSEKDYQKLFPVNQVLEPHKTKNLSVPGQYVIDSKVHLITNKGEIPLSIILPTRKQSVVEIGLSQAYKLGLKHLPFQLTSDSLDNPDNFVVISNGVNRTAVHAIIHIPHLHVPEELEIESTISVEIKGEYINMTLWNVPVKKVKGLNQSLLHLDNDTYNGIITMNVGKSFTAYIDTELVQHNIPSSSYSIL